MRGSLACLLLAVWLGAAFGQGSRVERIEIVEAGIYRADTAAVEFAPGTATGRRNVLSETRLVTATTRVEAAIGVHFGVRYRVVGRPDGASVKLVSVTLYPAPGLTNPASGMVQSRGEHTLYATIGRINYRGYVFEHDWEVVPGIWTIELWDGRRKLASQAFDVVKH